MPLELDAPLDSAYPLVTTPDPVYPGQTRAPLASPLDEIATPSIWSVLGRPYGATAPDGLRVIGTSEDIDFEGEGEILRVVEKPSPGSRTFEVDNSTGNIVDQTYTSVPTPYVIERTGDKAGKLALTFDVIEHSHLLATYNS